MTVALDLRPYADRARPMFGLVVLGEFSDEGLAAAFAQVDGALADYAEHTDPVVVIAEHDAAAFAERVDGGRAYSVQYFADGTRSPLPGRWTDRDPAAGTHHNAVARAVVATRDAGRRAQLLVLVGDQADAPERELGRELSRSVWSTGGTARVEYVGDAPQTVWCDTETTCRAPNMAGMIEFGGVACSSSSRLVLGTMELRLKIEDWMRVEQGALDINGYDPKRWALEGVDHDAGVSQVLAWMPRRFKLGAYNLGFDRSVIKHAVERVGGRTPGWFADGIDPMYKVRSQLKRAGLTEGAKLIHACDYYGISTECAHTALWDAHAARLVYLALMGEDVTEQARELGL